MCTREGGSRAIAESSATKCTSAQDLFGACIAQAGRAGDHAALVRALESLANFEVGERP